MDNVIFMSMIGAVAAMLVAWIWVVIHAFQESAGWGFATLLLNPIALFYALRRPEKFKYPLILFGIGLIVFLVGLDYAKAKDRFPQVMSNFSGAVMGTLMVAVPNGKEHRSDTVARRQGPRVTKDGLCWTNLTR